MNRRSNSKTASGTGKPGRSDARASRGDTAFLPAGQSHKHWLSMAVCLFLAVAVWAVFGQTRHFDFVNYDDDIYVYDNPAITQGFSLHGVAWLFTHPDGPDEWLPVTGLSRMLDWQFYGPNAGGHHLTNVLLHAATAILLFLVLQEMTGAIWRSAFVAAVFAIHPLRVESVAWVTERKDVLSGLFFMLTLWTYVRYVQKSTVPASASTVHPDSFWGSRFTLHASRFYWLAVVFFALGLMAKTMLVTVPFILLLLDYWPLQRSNAPTLQRFNASTLQPLLVEKIPFFALSAAACVTTWLMQTHSIVVARGMSLPWRAGNALMAYADYLGHMVYPVGLALIYPHPADHLPVWRIALSALLLLIITVVVVAGRRKHPYLFVGWLWYLVMLAPVIDVMQAVDSARADRYTYLPQIGLCLMVAWAAAVLGGLGRYWEAALRWAAGVIIATLMAAAYVQTGYWRNSVTLWARTLARTPQSSIAHCNYGIALAGQGNLENATQQFERALELNPEDVKTLNNLGKVLTTERKFDEAIQYFNRALQLNPRDAKALNNLGAALAAEGKLDEAVRQYQRAIQLKPDYADALNNLSAALNAQGQAGKAVQYSEQALQANPDNADALNNSGVALARQGRLDEAIQHFRRALQLNPDDASTHNNLGIALASQGKVSEAIPEFQQALNLATARGNTALVESIRRRLQSYQPVSPAPQTPTP
jgi:Flp pilus assembly protein TadD